MTLAALRRAKASGPSRRGMPKDLRPSNLKIPLQTGPNRVGGGSRNGSCSGDRRGGRWRARSGIGFLGPMARQYHLPRANPPNAMSPMRAMITPATTLQAIATTMPTITRIPPTEIPAIPPLRSGVAIPCLLSVPRECAASHAPRYPSRRWGETPSSTHSFSGVGDGARLEGTRKTGAGAWRGTPIRTQSVSAAARCEKKLLPRT